MNPTDPATDPKRQSPWLRLALLALFVAALAGFFAAGGHRVLSWTSLRGQLDTLQAQVQRNQPRALGVFFLTYVLVTAFSLPVAAPLSLTAGALFGRALGTLVVLLAATLGATLAMLSARYLLRDWVQARFGHRLNAVHRGIQRDGLYYLLTLRLVPAVPFFLINLAMGLSRMRVLPYALVSLLGMLPGTLLYVHAGTELGQIDTPGQVLSGGVLLALALLGIGPLLLRLLVRRLRPTHGDRDNPPGHATRD